jgi:hypothetical protein
MKQRITLEKLGEMVAEGVLQNLCTYCEYCRKIGYPTEKEAKDRSRWMKRKGEGKTWSYECPKGKGWHLTSSPLKKK